MADTIFNLLDEPWIKVMNPNGSLEEVGILELFSRAHEWKGLAGELPTQDVAVMRLLLAVLHTVFSRFDIDGEVHPISAECEGVQPADALARWKSLWDLGCFPTPVIEKYLNHHRDRFWLIHPKYPFYQAAELGNRNDIFGPFQASKLNGELAESDHKVRLFPISTGDKKNKLRYSEATRWLLYVNGFAETFGKLEAKGKTSKTDSSLGVGWLGKLGLITAKGDTIFETLLLNLVLLKDGTELWAGETPVWETMNINMTERNEINVPDNPSALLTLQSRRLLLKQEGVFVTGYILLSGDFFKKRNTFVEQMTIWSNPSKNKSALPEYNPRRHDPARYIWRDFPSLLSGSNGYRRPGVISWLAKLKEDGLIPSVHFHFQTAGVSYGTMEAVVDDVFSDNLKFNSNLLSSLGDAWITRIIDQITVSDKLVSEAGRFAQALAKAAGDASGKGPSDSAREQAYFRLDTPFRHWLESIDPQKDDMEEKNKEWWEQSKRIIRALGKELVEQSGLQAFIGRTLKENRKEILYSAPKAYNRFIFITSTPETLNYERSK